jgi:hypothetical protein
MRREFLDGRRTSWRLLGHVSGETARVAWNM